MKKVLSLIIFLVFISGCQYYIEKNNEKHPKEFCEQDSDCVQKVVSACCGFPRCANKNWILDEKESYAECRGQAQICYGLEMDCVCENNKCEGKLPTISEPSNPQGDECKREGGTWKEFPSTQQDLCGAKGGYTVLTDGCDCGDYKCWNGTSCVPSNQSLN